MPFVLDSTFIVDLARGDAGALALLQEMVEEPTANLIPTMVVAEYLAGCKDPAQDAELLQSAGEVQSFDLEDAKSAAAIAREALADGRFAGWSDTFIAGFAKNRDGIIVTRNPKHFPGARTRTY